MNCAKREPGRSWESIDSELKKLGEHQLRPPSSSLVSKHAGRSPNQLWQSMKKHCYTHGFWCHGLGANPDVLASWPLELERHPVLVRTDPLCSPASFVVPVSCPMPGPAHTLQHMPLCLLCNGVTTACWRAAAGLFPNSWPLPLTNSGLAQVRGNAARQPGAPGTTARGHAPASGHQLRPPAPQPQPVEPAPAQPAADTVQVSGRQPPAAGSGPCLRGQQQRPQLASAHRCTNMEQVISLMPCTALGVAALAPAALDRGQWKL